MLDSKLFDEFSQRLSNVMPSGIKEMQQDLQRNFHSMLQGTFAKLDLVTREEFDVQAGVLRRTRAKLEEAQQQLAELQAQWDQLQKKE